MTSFQSRFSVAASLVLMSVMLVACDSPRGASEADGSMNNPSLDLSSTDMANGVTLATALVFAHTSDTLFSIDPDTLAEKQIAPFGWPSGHEGDEMYDIALDKNGKMIGISSDTVYAVDTMTAKCTYLADFQGSTFNGLSYISADQSGDGTGTEILVGADTNGDVWKVDPTTGKQTQIGNYGNGYVSSGDLVSVEGATYATVNQGDDTQPDILVSVDAKTGVATKIGVTGVPHLYGLGYWKQKVFGFSDSNQFVTIDVTTGIAKVQRTGANSWFGAGVTTAAPTTIN